MAAFMRRDFLNHLYHDSSRQKFYSQEVKYDTMVKSIRTNTMSSMMHTMVRGIPYVLIL